MKKAVNRLAVATVAVALLAAFALYLRDSPRTDPLPQPAAAAAGNECDLSVVPRYGRGFRYCTFSDEFSGGRLDTSKWLTQQTSNSGYHSGAECFVDADKNVSVSEGMLNLTVQQEAAPFVCASPGGGYPTQYTSGSVSTWWRFSQTYGRFEIRARFPASQSAGLQSALWLYPQELKYGPWPHSGEIDIAETYSKYPDRAIPYLHYTQTGPDPTATNNDCLIDDVSEFHTYAAEWTPTSITITYDGATCLVHSWNPAAPLTKPAPFDQPFIVVLTQALGIGDNTFSPASTPLPATTQVDYVRVWS